MAPSHRRIRGASAAGAERRRPDERQEAEPPEPDATTPADRGPRKRVALVLSGGVALGAFEAGAYAALEEAGGPLPDWFVGASIGAVNAATGRRPSDRDVTRVVQAGVRHRWL